MTRTLLVLLLATVAASAQTAPTNMKLFLLIGQSNMAGRGKVEEQDKQTNPHIFMLTKERQWVLARDPLHFDKPVAGVGLASQFARVIAKGDPSATIGLIPCAVGGTSLGQWKPGEKLYTDAVARAKEAMKSGTLTGILWHQGEADSSPQKMADYADRFAAMIQQLRTDLGAAKVPVVMGELGRFHRNAETYNSQVPAIAAKVPLCAYVTSEDLSDKGDHIHFDSPSLRTYGERYAAAFRKLTSEH